MNAYVSSIPLQNIKTMLLIFLFHLQKTHKANMRMTKL